MTEKLTEKLINKYFNQKDILIKHQISSYDDYIDNVIPNILSQFFPLEIDINNSESNIKKIKVYINNYSISKPHYTKNNGCSGTLFPSIARLKNYTYSLSIYVDFTISVVLKDNDSLITLPDNIIKNVLLGKIPLMVQSKYCTYKEDSDMCKYDLGGYMIVNGNEKVIISQEKIAPNIIQIFKNNKYNKKYSYICEIRSINEELFCIPKLLSIRITNNLDKFTNNIYIKVPIVEKDIPIFIIFKIFGVLSDKEILYNIIDNSNDKLDTLMTNILLPSFEESFKIRTKLDAYEYLYPYLNQSYNYLSNESKNKYIQNYILKNILPHIKKDCDKVSYMGYMINRLIKVYIGIEKNDDRDSYINKRIETPGVLMANITYLCISKIAKEMKQNIPKEITRDIYSLNTKDFSNNIINQSNIHKLIKSSYIETCLKNSLATGNWGIKGSNLDKSGVSQVLNRLTYLSYVSHLRRVSATADITGKLIPPRKLNLTQWGYICPTETPEGQSIGLVKNMSVMSNITLQYSSEPIKNILNDKIIKLEDIDIFTYDKTNTKIFINGVWIGYTESLVELVHYIKEKRTENIINIHNSIYVNYRQNTINIYTDRGRCYRPLINLKYLKHNIDIDNLTWNQIILNYNIIDYIDIHEVNNTLQCISDKELKNKNYTHLEICASTILGVLASCIPFAHHNQSPRNTYQSAMGKQAMGIYSTKFNSRFDTFSHILNYPQKSLINTNYLKYFNSDRLPNGTNVIVAICSYSGYNQEDSVILNRGSIERGLFKSTFYRCYKDEEKKNQITGDEDIFCKPDLETVLFPKNSNYDKLNDDGFVDINTYVDENDILIGKVKPIKHESYTHRDTSVTVKRNESGYVDKIYKDYNEDGFKFCKVKLRSIRTPQIGDKFSSRHGQKGTVGMIFDQCDMPFTKDGIVPDIIINPHAVPSRMTIAQLLECIIGKACVLSGHNGNGTVFTKVNVSNIEEMLTSLDYEKNGNEVMYSGITGEQLKTSIFFGPTYYQRLKHMSSDKVHSRSTGPIVSITRQPSEGRASHGGLRFGEMERDCMISHGATNFLKERLMDVSDKYVCYICKKCGTLILYSQMNNVYECKQCNNYSSFCKIIIPYSCKLLFQELQCMSIIPRYLIKN